MNDKEFVERTNLSAAKIASAVRKTRQAITIGLAGLTEQQPLYFDRKAMSDLHHQAMREGWACTQFIEDHVRATRSEEDVEFILSHDGMHLTPMKLAAADLAYILLPSYNYFRARMSVQHEQLIRAAKVAGDKIRPVVVREDDALDFWYFVSALDGESVDEKALRKRPYMLCPEANCLPYFLFLNPGIASAGRGYVLVEGGYVPQDPVRTEETFAELLRKGKQRNYEAPIRLSLRQSQGQSHRRRAGD